MHITEETERTVEITTAYECDICGKHYADQFEIQEFTHIRFTGGYTSVFGDGFRYAADICQYCLKELLGEHLRCTRDPYATYTDNITVSQ